MINTMLSPENYPSLPKWPAIRVIGDPISIADVKDIIFRTDRSLIYGPGDFVLGGNDRIFQNTCIDCFGWRQYVENQRLDHELVTKCLKNGNELNTIADERRKLLPEWFDDFYGFAEVYRREMGFIPCQYLANDYLSTAYIGGPTGWCKLNGAIALSGKNIGKWPTVEEVAAEWRLLLNAFPFLNLECTLFSGESCEENISPICTFKVGKGHVTVHAGGDAADQPINKLDTSSMVNLLMQGDYSYERGLPVAWVDEFAAKSNAVMRKLAPSWFMS